MCRASIPDQPTLSDHPIGLPRKVNLRTFAYEPRRVLKSFAPLAAVLEPFFCRCFSNRCLYYFFVGSRESSNIFLQCGDVEEFAKANFQHLPSNALEVTCYGCPGHPSGIYPGCHSELHRPRMLTNGSEWYHFLLLWTVKFRSCVASKAMINYCTVVSSRWSLKLPNSSGFFKDPRHTAKLFGYKCAIHVHEPTPTLSGGHTTSTNSIWWNKKRPSIIIYIYDMYYDFEFSMHVISFGDRAI